MCKGCSTKTQNMVWITKCCGQIEACCQTSEENRYRRYGFLDGAQATIAAT